MITQTHLFPVTFLDEVVIDHSTPDAVDQVNDGSAVRQSAVIEATKAALFPSLLQLKNAKQYRWKVNLQETIYFHNASRGRECHRISAKKPKKNW